MAKKKLSKKQKSFIKRNKEKLSVNEISKKLDLTFDMVNDYVQTLNTPKSKENVNTKKRVNDQKPVFTSFKAIFDFYKKNKATVLFLTFITTLVYLNTLPGKYISDDISVFILKTDPLFTNFELALKTLKIREILSAFIYTYIGQGPMPQHALNIAWHSLNVVLFFGLACSALGLKRGSAAALLFGLHPINTEGVSWISGRVYPALGLSFLVVTWLLLLYENTKKKGYLVASVILYVILQYTMNTAHLIVVPSLAAVFVYGIYKQNYSIKRLLQIFVFLGALAAYTVFLLLTQITTRIATEQAEILQGKPWIVEAVYTTFMSNYLLAIPYNLTMYREGLAFSTGQFFLMSMYCLMVVLLLAFLFIKKKYQAFSILAFIFVSIAYTYSPWQVAWLMADRYLYVATMAWGMILAIVIDKISQQNRNSQRLFILLLTLISLLYGLRVVTRNYDWQNRQVLWEATARVSPNSPKVYNNLGDVYTITGELDKAEKSFIKAISLDQNYAEAKHNLALLYRSQGRLEEARILFNSAFEDKPTQLISLVYLAEVEIELNQIKEAEKHIQYLKEVEPNDRKTLELIKKLESVDLKDIENE